MYYYIQIEKLIGGLQFSQTAKKHGTVLGFHWQIDFDTEWNDFLYVFKDKNGRELFAFAIDEEPDNPSLEAERILILHLAYLQSINRG